MIATLIIPALATLLPNSPHPAPLADLYVDVADANCATGTGIAGSPVCSIGAAIAIAAPGDTIRIAPGTYFESVTIPFDLDLIGTSGASVTTMNGGGPGANVSVVTIPDAVTVTIDGLTIQNGSGTRGGGIQLWGALTLMNSTITHNVGFFGGGIGTRGASAPNSLTITNTSFSNNRASSGGAISLYRTSCDISNSTFDTNAAETEGGAVDFSGTLNDSTFSLVIEDSSFTGNEVRGETTDSGARGGGLHLVRGSLLLSGSTFSGNSSVYGYGGGIALGYAQFSISNSTVESNHSANFSNSIGGGIHIIGFCTGSISNSTVTRNSASYGRGGGMMIGGTSTVSVRNSIVAGNVTSPLTFFPNTSQDIYGAFTSLGHNLMGEGGSGFTSGFTNGVLGDQVGTIAAPLDPLLGPLQDNGGPTETCALLLGSPALDAGDPLTFETTDQRGVLRPQGSAPDIGAFEAERHFENFCNGDGGDQMGCTDCPCNNNAPVGTIGGCLNAAGRSARLLASGNPYASNDTMRMEASGLESFSFMLLTSAAAQAPAGASSPCFGANSGLHTPAFDGLRCVVQDFQRHGSRSVSANGNVGTGVPGPGANGWGGVSNPPGGLIATFGFASGQTRYFQGIYRTISETGCMRHLTTTQGIGVTFGP